MGNRLLVAAAVLAASCGASRPSGDGRLPDSDIHARFAALEKAGWLRETVHAYADGEPPILAWRTPKPGRALWVLAGIHGEEPAGPNAAARRAGELAALADSGVPVVLLPLCNPRAYARGWRYPNTKERDWRKGGYSVGDAEHLLPALEDETKPRTAKPAGPESASLTEWALETAKTYPPGLVLDLHEDELSTEGGYIYSQGVRADDAPAGAEIIKVLRASGIPIRLTGKTRFGEPVKNGVVSRDDKGGPIRDGSIDELFAAKTVFKDGKPVPGPAAPAVFVVETPAFAGSDLARRVAAQAAVLDRAAALWTMSR